MDGSAHEMIKKLEEEVQGFKKNHAEEMNIMKQNQEKLISELTFMRYVFTRFFPIEYMPPTSRRSSEGQVVFFKIICIYIYIYIIILLILFMFCIIIL